MMLIQEYGQKNEKTVVIFHDMAPLSWENTNLPELTAAYHIVVLSLEDDENIPEITKYLKSHYNNKLYAVCAFQSEWKLFNILLRKEDLEYEKMVIENDAPLSGKVMGKLIAQM